MENNLILPGLLQKRLIPLVTILTISMLLFSTCKKVATSEQHTVTFVSNGGTNFAPAKVAQGQPLPLDRVYPDPIVSDGGTFVGWYKDSLFKEEYDFSLPVLNDLTLYAKWYYKTYTLSFEMNGAPAWDPIQVRVGKTVELPIPTYDGHIFINWYTDEALTQIFNRNVPVEADMKLYARWLERSPEEWFTIDGNGVLVGCNPPDGVSLVVIPDEVKEIPAWFVLANGLNEPGKPGFPQGKNIKEFILPDGLEVIGTGAFKYSGITSITIPPNVKVLTPVTFTGCDRLESFNFAEGSKLERLLGNDGNESVIEAPLLQSISFPPSLQYVGKYTLSGSNGLKVVTFERSESPVIFDSFLPGGGVWLFGGYFPAKISVPNQVKDAFISEMRKVMGDYEFDNMKSITEGY